MSENLAELDRFLFNCFGVKTNVTGTYILRLLLYVLTAAEPVHMSIQESGPVSHKVCACAYVSM